jgi:hypothetical protein
MTDTAQPTRHVTTTRIVAVRGSALEYRADRAVADRRDHRNPRSNEKIQLGRTEE